MHPACSSFCLPQHTHALYILPTTSSCFLCIFQPGDFDIETGWSLNERNWAVLTAAENAVETAEQVSGGVRLSEVQDPSAAATVSAQQGLVLLLFCVAVMSVLAHYMLYTYCLLLLYCALVSDVYCCCSSLTGVICFCSSW